jgi:hypothetical protein
VNNYGVPKSLIRVIHRGVDTDVLSAPGESPRALAGTETAARWIPVVGSIGSLTRVKGHHIFIRAARRALDLGAEALFAIVGEGEEEPALRRLVKELGLQYQVTFSPHIPSRRQLYGTFDMIVVPTLRGGVGSTALEAMSMGRPVIASAVGEILHVIQDGKNGVLVPEGDVEALAQAIVDLISRPEYRAALGQAARANVVESFSLDPMVKATREFYEEILGRLEEPGSSSRAPRPLRDPFCPGVTGAAAAAAVIAPSWLPFSPSPPPPAAIPGVALPCSIWMEPRSDRAYIVVGRDDDPAEERSGPLGRVRNGAIFRPFGPGLRHPREGREPEARTALVDRHPRDRLSAVPETLEGQE